MTHSSTCWTAVSAEGTRLQPVVAAGTRRSPLPGIVLLTVGVLSILAALALLLV